MRKKIKIGFILFISLIIGAYFVSATIPQTLNLQGKLTDSSNDALSGSFKITFKIYNVSTGGNALYQSINQTVITDSNGIYHVILNNINLTFEDQHYLGIQVENDPEMTPRINLTSTPYTFNSKLLDGNKASFFMPLNTSVTGNFDFNGAWQTGGLSIINGDIYAQTVFAVNLTALNVSSLDINGSLSPQSGFDNIFDLGSSSLRWRDLWIGRDALINGILTAVNIKSNDWTNVSITESQISDLTHTIDTNETTRFDNLVLTDCAAGTLVIGIQSDGTVLCATDSGGGGNSSAWNRSGTNVILANTGDNVGIGTSSPDMLLSLEDGDTIETGIQINNTSPVGGQEWRIRVLGTGVSGRAGHLSIRDSTNLVNPIEIENGTGNVGIGTTSPSSALEINGTLTINDGTNINEIRTNSTNSRLDFITDRLTDTSIAFSFVVNGSTRALDIADNGNVGIGTTSPSQPLHIFGEKGVRLQSSNAANQEYGFVNSIDNLHLTQNAYFDGTTWKSIENSTLAGGFQTNLIGTEVFRVFVDTNVTDADEALTFDALMVVKTDGNVGIGTTSPRAKLEVQDPIGGNITLIRDDGGSTLKDDILGQILFDSTVAVTTIDAPVMIRAFASQIHTPSVQGGYLTFETKADGTSPSSAATERIRITSEGNVGIGTTSPQRILHLAQNSPELVWEENDQAANSKLWRLWSSVGQFRIQALNDDFSSVSIPMVWDRDGNVGIGTTSPVAPLQVVGSSLGTNANDAISLFLLQNSNGNTNYLNITQVRNSTGGSDWTSATTRIQQITDVTKQAYIDFNPPSGIYGLAFGTGSGGIERMRITSSGNVGIGTTSPTELFQIVGDDIVTQWKSTTGKIFNMDYNVAENMWKLASTSQHVGIGIFVPSNADFSIFTNNLTRVFVKENGNVGIGTTSPDQKLTVNGAINASGGIDSNGDGIVLKTKVLEIGDWNMDSTEFVSITHELTLAKIRGISALIRNDADTGYYAFNGEDTNAGFDRSVVAFDTTVRLRRVTSAFFDTTSFDATAFNRGWITIIYEA